MPIYFKNGLPLIEDGKLAMHQNCCCPGGLTTPCDSCQNGKAPFRFQLAISGHVDCPMAGIDCTAKWTVFNGNRFLYDQVIDNEGEICDPAGNCWWWTDWHDYPKPEGDSGACHRLWYPNFLTGPECETPHLYQGNFDAVARIEPVGEPPWRLTVNTHTIIGNQLPIASHFHETFYNAKPDCFAIDETFAGEIQTDCGPVTITYRLTSA